MAGSWAPSNKRALTAARLPCAAPSRADGRHLDAYDTHAAQYWPCLQAFLDQLKPAAPLPAEGAAAGGAVELQAPAQESAPRKDE